MVDRKGERPVMSAEELLGAILELRERAPAAAEEIERLIRSSASQVRRRKE